MKKKLVSFMVLAMLAGSAQLFAWGIGLQGGGGPGAGGGLAVTFKLDQLPLVFAADIGFGGGFGIGATADYWIMNPTIMDWDWGAWNWFWGAGAGANVFFYSGYTGLNVGPRIFAGMNLEFLKGAASWLDHLEVFLQATWQPMFHFGFGDASDGFHFWALYIPITAGVRMWF